MVKIGFAMISDYAAVCAGGKLSINGIFDALFTRHFPTIIPHLYLVIRLEADATDAGKKYDSKIELIDEDGKPMVALEGFFTVPPAPPGRTGVKHEQIFPLFNLAFEKAGTYDFKILINNEVRGSVPLYINHIKEQNPLLN